MGEPSRTGVVFNWSVCPGGLTMRETMTGARNQLLAEGCSPARRRWRLARARRVVVTGIGAITPIGLGREGLWAGLRNERSAVGPVTRFDPSQFRSHLAAEVKDFVPTDHLDERRSRRFDRFAQFSVVSARMALEDADLDLARENRERVGAMMGSAMGGVVYAEHQMACYMAGGVRAVDATLALGVFGGGASCNIAIECGAFGPNSTNAMSCASGTIAVGDAFRAIRDDYADVMICGGAEVPLSPLCYGAFALIRAMSTRNTDPLTASRPFDRGRDGFVMGEGASILILEERDRALARGAHIYAEVSGFGVTNDGHHITAPQPEGTQAARAMRLALADAHVAPGEVGYVNAHGSSTPRNDPTETLAVKHVFGDHAYRIPMSGTKGYYGHALGASGAIEAAICALALEREWLPPTVNLVSPDPACDLDYLPGIGRRAEPEIILSNSFGFGGINASLVMRKHVA
jgi:3-oxoacyl-[acyl-carrier-protein] synthase II